MQCGIKTILTSCDIYRVNFLHEFHRINNAQSTVRVDGKAIAWRCTRIGAQMWPYTSAPLCDRYLVIVREVAIL